MGQNNLPKYVFIVSALGSVRSALKLDGSKYWRNAGHWGVGFKFDGDKLVSISQEYKHLNGLSLLACTEEEWREDNKGYV